MRNHFGIHTRFAHPARDQLRVLRTEVDDKDWSLGFCHRHSLKSDTGHTAPGQRSPASPELQRTAKCR
ncbi:hypothetical protein NSERUTF1_1149 [Nocardia seriolae]|nr:hypothetical protein NSERUTF1_1149 [Nocardia seriolae]